MDRQLLIRHLSKAEETVARGEETVRRQRELIARLERRGRTSPTALAVLKTFEGLQAAHVADRDRWQMELAKLS